MKRRVDKVKKKTWEKPKVIMLSLKGTYGGDPWTGPEGITYSPRS